MTEGDVIGNQIWLDIKHNHIRLMVTNGYFSSWNILKAIPYSQNELRIPGGFGMLSVVMVSVE